MSKQTITNRAVPRPGAWIIAIVLVGRTSFAAQQAIEDIGISRSGDVATAAIALGCRMRYLDHSPRRGGVELRVRLFLAPECRSQLGGVRNELHHPKAGHMGHIDNLEFDTPGLGEATLTIRFKQSVGFKVSQGAMFNAIRIQVDTKAKIKAQSPSLPTVASVTPSRPEVRDRRPLRLTPVKIPSTRDLFAISLTTFAPRESVDLTSLASFETHLAYVEELTVAGQTWKELRLGFFASEADARAELPRVTDDWPEAWISVANPEEQARAKAGRLVLPAAARPDARVESRLARDGGDDSATTVPEGQIAALMAAAKATLIAREYERSAQIYTRVLEAPYSEHHREAREYLGVAREKQGQSAHAKAEYESFLLEFPDDPGAPRVQQRLAGLDAGAAIREEKLRPARRPDSTAWNIDAGISQFYRRDVNQLREYDEETVSQSALLSQAHLVVQRRGPRFDLLGKMNGGYYHDMLDEDQGPGNQGLISYAYLDISDRHVDVTARVGRQTRYTGGVLGRFDGAHITYAWKPNLSINVTTGFPVDAPRYVTNTDRIFYGASIDFANVAEAWDFSVFSNLQRIDGISEREAIGAEARFANDRWNLVAVADFDVSYSVLNSALLIGTWRVGDRLTLNGRFNFGASPFLTTRNALIGQSVNTVDELLETYSEAQVRRLARDRTAQAHMASLGFSASVSQRFQWNGNITYSEADATNASGGVAAVPATGPQYFVTSNLVGASLLKPGDMAIFGLRHDTTRTANTSTVSFDMRYPISNGLRINPRIALAWRESQLDDSSQWIAAPMLRLTYRWRRRYRVEFEAGGQWSSRDLPRRPVIPLATHETEESSAYYLNIGYMMDF